jgi:polar amino acid transport system substrate-binding protein
MPQYAFAKCSRIINVPLPALNAANNNVSSDAKRSDLTAYMILLMGDISEKLGCQFNYLSVPKTRQELLFGNGEADILFMATKTAKRDEVGLHVPLLKIKPSIVSNTKFGLSNITLKRIQEDQKLHLVLVRGFDYGIEYNEFVQTMENDKRVSYEPDVFSVARMMSYKENVVTIIRPSIFEEVLSTEKVLSSLLGNIHYSEVEEFAWIDMGIYISKATLSEKDFTYLKINIPLIMSNDKIWNWLQKKYSKDILAIGFRQIEISPIKK